MIGRPNEGREKLTCYVLPETMRAIRENVSNLNPAQSTLGRVLDLIVQIGANVAGAGRKAPQGQHGRAKQKQSRAKRANQKLTGESPV